MKTEIVERNNKKVAIVDSEELLITDVASALELIMTVKYETGCENIAINKDAIRSVFYIKHMPGRRNITEVYQLRHKNCDIWRFFKI